MFKAPIKMLHPLLTATQEGNYIGTENIGAHPVPGHHPRPLQRGGVAELQEQPNNEAFIDRICVVKVPYCLRATEERQIYEKLLQTSELAEAPCAPETLEMLARFCVLSRLKEHENSNLFSKMRVYDGESLKDTDPRAKTVQEYRDAAGVDEGMTGISTRFAFKVLSSTFNFDTQEVAADPVHLMYVLEQSIRREQFPERSEKKLLDFIKAELAPRYAEFIGNEIQKAYLESYGDYGQNLFDRYVAYADAWIEDQDFKDPDTGQLLDRELLEPGAVQDREAGGHRQPQGFPQRGGEVRAARAGRATTARTRPGPSYEKMREVIEKRMFTQVEDLLPVISFGSKKDSDTEKKHADFLERMMSRGYTRAPGAPPGRVVHARQQGRLGRSRAAERSERVDEHHRPPPNPKGKSLTNRQRFLERARAEVERRGARCAEASARSAMSSSGEKVVDPDAAASPSRCSATAGARRQARLRRARQQGIRRAATRSSGRKAAAAAAAAARPAPTASGEQDAFEFMLSKEEFLDLFFEDLELPDLVKTRSKETTAIDLQRAGFSVDRLADQSQHPRAPCATAWRAASRCTGRSPARSRRCERQIAEAREADDADERGAAPDPLLEAAQRRAQRSRLHRSGRCALQPLRARAQAQHPGGDVLPDGRVGLDDRGDEGSRQAVLHAAARVPDAPLQARRRRLHPPHLERQEVDEETFFHSRETGGTIVSTALEEMLEIVRERYRPTAGTSTRRRPRTATITPRTASRCSQLLGGEILPLCQYFAYIEVGDERPAARLPARRATRSVARLQRGRRRRTQHFAMRRVADPAQIFPVFHELFAKGGVHA